MAHKNPHRSGFHYIPPASKERPASLKAETAAAVIEVAGCMVTGNPILRYAMHITYAILRD